MLRHELYSMIHVPRLKDENATELFLPSNLLMTKHMNILRSSCELPE